MSRFSALFKIVTVPALTVLLIGYALAEQPPPQAPANISWLPHGYGERTWVNNTTQTLQKGILGFRPAPEYTAAWSEPIWGWDVNGYYCGPQVPRPDPGEHQLPIGLIYPGNEPAPPPIAGAYHK